MARTRTVASAGVLATTALVLIFGNQAFTEWADKHTKADTVWGWFLRTLTWPSWAVGPRNGSNGAMRDLLAADLRALLLILFVALILGIAAKSVSGGAGGFILGWAALIFASALAAFVTAFIVSNPTMLGAFEAAAAGSAYGLFVGWIVGILTATAKSAGGPS
jgi:hypothetical protein